MRRVGAGGGLPPRGGGVHRKNARCGHAAGFRRLRRRIEGRLRRIGSRKAQRRQRFRPRMRHPDTLTRQSNNPGRSPHPSAGQPGFPRPSLHPSAGQPEFDAHPSASQPAKTPSRQPDNLDGSPHPSAGQPGICFPSAKQPGKRHLTSPKNAPTRQSNIPIQVGQHGPRPAPSCSATRQRFHPSPKQPDYSSESCCCPISSLASF